MLKMNKDVKVKFNICYIRVSSNFQIDDLYIIEDYYIIEYIDSWLNLNKSH